MLGFRVLVTPAKEFIQVNLESRETNAAVVSNPHMLSTDELNDKLNSEDPMFLYIYNKEELMWEIIK